MKTLKDNFKKLFALIISLSLFVTGFSRLLSNTCQVFAQEETSEVEYVEFTDDVGRVVLIPNQINRVLASGVPSQTVLFTVAPERMVGWNKKPKDDSLEYLPEQASQLAEVGSLYSSGGDINLEEIVQVQPDIIIDLGQQKDGIREDLDQLQDQTGIPVVFLNGMLTDMPQVYEKLGQILSVDTSDQVAYLERVIKMAEDNRETVQADPKEYALIRAGDKIMVASQNSYGSQVFDLIGLESVLKDGDLKGSGFSEVSPEQILEWDPESLVFTAFGPYDNLDEAPWDQMQAVKTGKVVEVPYLPFNWLTGSVNYMLGIPWIGNLYYPDLYDIDMVQEVQDFYKLFYDFELSQEEAQKLLENAQFKD